MGENQFWIHKKNLNADRAINDKILVLYNAFKDHKEIRAKVLLRTEIDWDVKKSKRLYNFPYPKVKQRSNTELGI